MMILPTRVTSRNKPPFSAFRFSSQTERQDFSSVLVACDCLDSHILKNTEPLPSSSRRSFHSRHDKVKLAHFDGRSMLNVPGRFIGSTRDCLTYLADHMKLYNGS